MTAASQSRVRGGDNRARLLQLGAALFSSQGYAQISVRDLAARLGVSTGAIYSNFRSKGDLLAEILEVRVREDMERSQRSPPDLWLPEAAHDNFLRLPERQQMRALLLEAGAAARTDHELRDSLKPTLTALIGRSIGDYRAWQQLGKVDPRLDMADLVTLLWSIELGVGVLEAQGAVRSRPAALADFVGTMLQRLEEKSGQPPEDGRRKLGRVGLERRRKTSAPTARGRRERRSPGPRALESTAPGTPEKLVNVAMELFAEKGYAAVSVRDIGRASGLTTGSLYGNFANKADLLVAAIELRLARHLELLRADLVRSGSPADMIQYGLQGFSGRAGLRALIIEGAAAARADRDVHDRLREGERQHQESWVESFATWLHTNGIVASFDPWTAVTLLWSAELGLGLFEALDLYTPPPAALATLFGLCFGLAGLEPPASHPPRRGAGGQPGR